MLKRSFLALVLSLALAAPASALGVVDVGFDDEGTVLEAAGSLTDTNPESAYRVALNISGYAQMACLLPNGRTVLGDRVAVSTGARSVFLPPGETAFHFRTFEPVVLEEQAGCPPQTRLAFVEDVEFARAALMIFENDVLVAVVGYAL